MMGKRVLLLLLGLILVCSMATAAPVNVSGGKVFISIIYHKEGGAMGTGQSDVTSTIQEDRLIPLLRTNGYTPILDGNYLKKIQDMGYGDFSDAERADLMAVFKDSGFKYAIIMDVQPLKGLGRWGWGTEAITKIIDIENNKYIFSGKIGKRTQMGGHNSVFKQIGKELNNKLIEKGICR